MFASSWREVASTAQEGGEVTAVIEGMVLFSVGTVSFVERIVLFAGGTVLLFDMVVLMV